MRNNQCLPYSDERLATIMGIDPSELNFLIAKDEIKSIIKDYNLFLKSDIAINELKKVKEKYKKDQMICDAISKIINYIKLI